MKKVWIINHYAGGMFFNKGGRHYNFAKYLHRKEYDVRVFCCNAKHNSQAEEFFFIDGLWEKHHAEEINTPFIFVKARTYVGNGKRRVLNMLDFYFNIQKVARQYAKQDGKPDVIIGSSVHPLACIAAIRLSKLFNCKNVVEIRDLWPESLVAYNVVKKKSLLTKLLYLGEKWIYKKADSIVFTVEGGADYIVEHRWDKDHGGPIDINKVHYINNGVDLETFNDNRKNFIVSDSDLDNAALFKVVYTGAIRRVNEVERLVEVAKILNEKGKNSIKILLWGAGDYVDMIQQLIDENGLENIELKGYINKRYIPSILERSNLNIYVYKESPLLKYGLSLNKSFEYFASGKPVLASANSRYSLMDRYQCGVGLEKFTPERMAEEIIRFASMSKAEYESYCTNATYAAEEYDFKKLTDKLIEVIN